MALADTPQVKALTFSEKCLASNTCPVVCTNANCSFFRNDDRLRQNLEGGCSPPDHREDRWLADETETCDHYP
jgi:hypothetical protein